MTSPNMGEASFDSAVYLARHTGFYSCGSTAAPDSRKPPDRKPEPARCNHVSELGQPSLHHHKIEKFLTSIQQSVLAFVAGDALMAGAAEFLHPELLQFLVVIDDQQPARLRTQLLNAFTSG